MMTDEEMITRLRGNITLSKEGACVTLLFTDPPKELGNCETYGFCEEVADRIEAKAAEIEKLEAKLERGLSRAKGIEMACLGLRDEAQPMTAKEAARKMIAELTGDKP